MNIHKMYKYSHKKGLTNEYFPYIIQNIGNDNEYLFTEACNNG